MLRIGFIILALALVVAAKSDEAHSEEYGNDTEAEHGGHDRIHLVSLKWEEYSQYFYFTLIIAIACLAKVGFHHVDFCMHYFPESCVLIVIGVITGLVVDLAAKDIADNFPAFSQKLFFDVLLPPIILDAAYSLYDEDFFRNLNPILLFAVIGTVFNVFIVAGLLFGVYQLNAMPDLEGLGISDLPITYCLVFAAIVAAVDPVAVLAIFEEIGVNMVLYFLVFGESLLNDGVSVVVYNTMRTLSSQETITVDQYFLAVASFFFVVLGGILIGSLVGVLTALVLRLTSRARVLEPLIIIIMAYVSYIGAELVHWSGIISLVACGIFQKRYAFMNASRKSYTTVKYGVKTLSSTSDCIIFIFLGKVAANKFDELDFNWSFIVSTIVIITMVRFLGVFLLSGLVNTRRTKPISLREQVGMRK